MRSFLRALIFSMTALAFGSATAWADPVRALGTPSGKPFTFLNVDTNKLQGVMVDLINQVAVEEKFEVKIDTSPWASVIPALTSGRADVSIAISLITPARAEIVDFTEPLFRYGEGLVLAASDNRDISSLKELEGSAVGVQIGTAYYKTCRIRALSWTSACMRALPISCAICPWGVSRRGYPTIQCSAPGMPKEIRAFVSRRATSRKSSAMLAS